MYHAACKVEFRPFSRSYSQLTFKKKKKKKSMKCQQGNSSQHEPPLLVFFERKHQLPRLSCWPQHHSAVWTNLGLLLYVSSMLCARARCSSSSSSQAKISRDAASSSRPAHVLELVPTSSCARASPCCCVSISSGRQITRSGHVA